MDHFNALPVGSEAVSKASIAAPSENTWMINLRRLIRPLCSTPIALGHTYPDLSLLEFEDNLPFVAPHKGHLHFIFPEAYHQNPTAKPDALDGAAE